MLSITNSQYFGSVNFNSLLTKEVNKRIDLQFLREIYLEDEKKFILLVQELTLRGFKFHLAKPNNLFHNIEFESDPFIIIVNMNKGLYKKINFDKYKFGNILNKFKINNDLFFNLIPIEGFKVFDPYVNLEEFKKNLVNIGFEVMRTSEYMNLKLLKNNLVNNIDKTQFLGDNESNENNYSGKTLLSRIFDDYLIEKVFNKNAYQSFVNFCRKLGIIKIGEISNFLLEQYSNVPGVGTRKVDNVKDMLLKLSNGQIDIYKEKECSVDIPNIVNVPISKIFCENKFSSFVGFCKNNNIETIGEISEEELERYSKTKGIGVKRVEIVRKNLSKYITIKKENFKIDYNMPIVVEEKWYSVIYNYKIADICKMFDIDFTFDSNLTFKEIQNKTISDLGTKDKYESLIKIVRTINRQLTIKEIILTAVETVLNNRDKKILYFRYNDGFSLEQLGKEFNITRERARQIIIKAINKLKDSIHKYDIELIIKLINKDKTYCTEEQFYRLVGSENYIYGRILVNEELIFSHYKALEILYFNEIKKLKNKIAEFIKSLPSTFKLYDYLDELIDILENYGIYHLEIDKFQKLLKEYDFTCYGEFFTCNKLYIRDMFSILFKDYIEEPLYFDDDGFEKLRALCIRYFGINIESTLQSAENRIREIEDVVLVDKRTFIHIEKLKISKYIIDNIHEMLNLELENKQVISATFIFDKYKNRLKNLGVNNKYIVYSIVQYYLSNYFIIGKGNTLNISKSYDLLSKNREEQIIEIIIQNGGKIERGELLKLTGWKLFKLEDTIGKSERIIKIGKIIADYEMLNLEDKIKDKIISILNNEIKMDGFTTSNKLFNNMVIFPEIYKFFKKNYMDSGEKIVAFIKRINPNIKGNTFFLYLDGSKYDSFENVILDKFNDVCSKFEIKRYMDSYNMNETTVYSLMNNLVSSGKYVQISDVELLPTYKLDNIKESVIKTLIIYIEEKFKSKEYLSLNKINGYKRKLPSIEYEWNIYLISTILQRHGYRKIEKTYYDPSTERIILVKEDSAIRRFDELVYYILKNEYKGNMHETKICDYLIENGIIYNNKKQIYKKLPYDLYESDKFDIDEVGRVEFIGEQ